jgi:outer membrane lipoprotein-sorting protein
MSKLLSGIIIAVGLTSLTSTVRSQVSPPSPIITQSQPQKSVTSTVPDLVLLSKAARILWQTDRAETESQMLISAGKKGAEVKVNAQIKTIAKMGNKFLTQLTFAPPGSIAKSTYTIVSNGDKVWIYQPERRRYAQTTYSKFKSGNNSFWMGGSSFLFLTITETERRNTISMLGTDQDFIKLLDQSQIKDLQGQSQQVNGRDSYIYSYQMKENNMMMKGFVDPATGAIQKIELVGNSQGLKINFVEQIISRNHQVNLANQAFVFLPPPGIKKVKSLEIDPFDF